MSAIGSAAMKTRRTAGLAVLISHFAAFPACANPIMSDDVARIMGWMSQQMVQGLAFNAGSTFDPPQEVKGYSLQPDSSLGIGMMPLDKSKFPMPETAALQGIGIEKVFPSKVLFPNLTMHLRAGLPERTDFSFRFTDMTTPPNYKIADNTTGKGQSNSIGFGLRKHFFGGDDPGLALGANYNYVFGGFRYKTMISINDPSFTTDSNVNGAISWNVNSFGLNAVVNQRFGAWTPFFGLGYNYATGSVRARLDVLPQTPLISPIRGEASSHPESSQGRLILGMQMNRSWVNFFCNGEVKLIGEGAGQSWIVHSGFLLPFRIGGGGHAFRHVPLGVSADKTASLDAQEPDRWQAPEQKPNWKAADPAYKPAEKIESSSDLIFIQ